MSQVGRSPEPTRMAQGGFCPPTDVPEETPKALWISETEARMNTHDMGILAQRTDQPEDLHLLRRTAHKTTQQVIDIQIVQICIISLALGHSNQPW